MTNLSWRATRRLVHERANGCCEYCQACEHNTGQPMHVEHINPDGGDDPSNLCLSCSSCNFSKGIAVTGYDSESTETVMLFNPRQQIWKDHFEWLDGGLRLLGKTPIGRGTIQRLKMNQERLVRARQNWIEAGNHPPKQ